MKQYGLPLKAIKQLQTIFQRHADIHRVWLYGSRAKGNYRPGSDIDLCIEAPQWGMSQLLALDNEIDDLLLPWQIDLSLKHQIDNHDLLLHIAEFGLIFYPG